MMQVGQSWPNIWQVAGDKMIRAMDWPDADEIADRVARTIPAEIRDDPNDQGQQQLPPQVQQVLQQAQQQIQQMQQALQEAQSGMDKAKLDAHVKVQIEQMRIDSAERIAAESSDVKRDVAELSGVVQLLLQRIQPPPALAGEVSEDLGEQPQTEPAQAGFFTSDDSQQPLAG
jgi:hypothetical protein